MIQYMTQTGEVFNHSLLYGEMDHPVLKYFYHVSRDHHEYTYFIAYVYDESEDINVPVGLLELQNSPYEENETWLKYITVDPKYQNNGVGKRLVLMMCEYLSGKNIKLTRSTPSSEGRAKIYDFISEELDNHNIEWSSNP